MKKKSLYVINVQKNEQKTEFFSRIIIVYQLQNILILILLLVILKINSSEVSAKSLI